MKLNWIPLKNVGPFKLDENIDNYISRYNLVYYQDEYLERTTGGRRFIFQDNETDIYTDKDNKIITICCEESLILDDINLIGLTIEKLIEIFASKGSKPEEFIDEIDMPDDSIQQVYEFDELGAQVWVESGIVVTVICSPYIEDDE